MDQERGLEATGREAGWAALARRARRAAVRGLGAWAQALEPRADAGVEARSAGRHVPAAGPPRVAHPTSHPPTVDVRDADVPAPLTRDRIVGWLTAEELPYFVDNDGDVGGVWGGRLFYTFCFGERGEILQVRGQWHRDLTIERLTEVLEICNEWNADTLLPKAYARVRDDGMVHVVAESAVDLEHGVTDEQLGRLVRTGVAAAGALFERLDQLYVDPVRTVP